MHTGTHDVIDEEVTVPNETQFAELHLVTANVEKAVGEYLFRNGALLDQETRMFLANIREVMGATSRRAKKVATASRT